MPTRKHKTPAPSLPGLEEAVPAHATETAAMARNAAEQVDVYCDLHRKVSSVKALSGPSKGRVVDKPREIVLEDVTFRVSQAAVRKIHETGVRSVHAYARGIRTTGTPQAVRDRPDAVRIRYNPHLRGEFYEDGTGMAVTHLSLFAVDGKTAWGVR